MVVDITLGKADSVSGLGAGDDDLLDTEFAGGFNYVVSCSHVASEALVIWDEHVASVGGKVDDNIWRLRDLGVVVAGKVEMGGEGIEDLTAVGEIGLEGEDIVIGSREVDQVKVQDLHWI